MFSKVRTAYSTSFWYYVLFCVRMSSSPRLDDLGIVPRLFGHGSNEYSEAMMGKREY